MFAVDELTAEAIRHTLNESGELAAIAELRRHFPLIGDNAGARLCVRAIAGWRPLPAWDGNNPATRLKPRRPR
jgi:hypothetical protein